MAHFVIYKRPAEVTPYVVDFTDLVAAGATTLAGATIVARDSAGLDQTAIVIQSQSTSGLTFTAILQGGIDGEDYLINYFASGNTGIGFFNRILEMRVRLKIAGNL